MPNTTHRVLLATIAGTLLLTLLPPAQAQSSTFTEGFEDCAQFDIPTISGCDSPNYDLTVNGGSTIFVATTPVQTGTKSLKIENPSSIVGGGKFTIKNGATSDDICGRGGIEWWINFDELPTANRLRFEAVNSVSTEYIRMDVDAAGLVRLVAKSSNSGTIAGPSNLMTVAEDTWYHFRILCSAPPAGGSIFLQEFTTQSQTTLTFPAAQGGSKTAFSFYLETADTYRAYLDNINFGEVLSSATGDKFCANPGESNFGYDYLEGVEFVSVQPVGISLEDSFLFEGDSSNSEYLAKGYNPGTEAFLVRARLEASSGDWTSSKFRVAFTTGATTLAAGSTQDSPPTGADFLASSDGEDGGNFDNHIQLILQENGNAWSISAWYNVAGAGLTQIPGTVNYGADPNTPTTFQVVVNSGTTSLPATVENHTIGVVGDEAIAIQDGDGNTIQIWPLPTGLLGVDWKDQWFIGKGTGVANAFTYLDDTDQLQDDDSTCLWDLLGTGTRTGSAGLAPGSTIIDPPTTVDDTGGFFAITDANTPTGFTVDTFKGFLGVLLMAAIAAGLYFSLGKSPILAILGAGAGFFLAFFLGLFEIWVIVVVVVLAVAALFLRFKGSAA